MLASLLAPPATARAQTQTRIRRIGFLGAADASGWASRIEALRAGLRDLGWVEGKNIVFEFRWADGHYDRLPALAAELVHGQADVLITHGTPGSRATKLATTAVPIVMVLVGDPVGAGLVASLARPGGNITGTTFFSAELAAKRIELLKQAVPRIRRIAALVNSDNPTGVDAVRATARSLGVQLELFGVRRREDLADAMAAMVKQGYEAVTVAEDGLLNAHLGRIAELAARQRLPSTGSALLPELGGMMGYGIDNRELYRRAAYFVDRILGGTKPSELPVERPTKFELILNMKTATALGVTIPKAVLLRTDRVIE